jgi:hypothetical protein
MNTPIVGESYFICKVQSWGKRNFGFAMYRGDVLIFHLDKGREIKMISGSDHPNFTEGTNIPFPIKGASIVAIVAKGPQGYFAPKWGHLEQFLAVKEEIKVRKNGKPAPRIPQILRIDNPMAEVDLGTEVDRRMNSPERGIFVPSFLR